jgi:hypothetical protein
VFKVPRTTLRRRRKEIGPKQGSRAKNNLLLPIEEEQLVQWILEMERRGFPFFIIDVKRSAERLISRRGARSIPPPIGKCWVYRFITHHPALKQRLTRNKDPQRPRQERPSVIQPWFQLIEEITEQYGIVDGDKYNFDETGFAMGLISESGAAKVVGSSDNVGRVTITQPGERTWMTSIECANATGWMIPPLLLPLARSIFVTGTINPLYHKVQTLP